MDAAVSTLPLRLALVGVPNCGKTALFNRLTGSRQKVANYPGVTVERREGERTASDGRTLRVLDLPGTYSLKPTTLDEAITRDVLLGRVADAPAPDLVICVVDAVHLPIGLRLALEVKRVGLPMVLALNRMDVARRRGVKIDVARLSAELGVPVLPTVAVKRGGADALIEAIEPTRWPAARSVVAGQVAAQVTTNGRDPRGEDAEQTQADLRGVLVRDRLLAARRESLGRTRRRAAAAPAGRHPGAGRGDVPHLPGRVQLGDAAHGRHRSWHGALGGWVKAHMSEGRWPACWPTG
jgi:small GTP-binding protein